jgi:hypothetical protein
MTCIPKLTFLAHIILVIISSFQILASSGAGAPDDKPPGDEPLGGKGKQPDADAAFIPELALAELMEHGVQPVVAPLQKQTAKKFGIRPYVEYDMCPEVRKRRVRPPPRGMPRSEVPLYLEALRRGQSHGEGTESAPVNGEKKGVPAEESVTSESEESSLDSDASDVEHYLYEPVKEYHPVDTPPSSDSEEEPEPPKPPNAC